MKIDIPFGDKIETVYIPDKNVQGVYFSNKIKIPDQKEVARRAVKKPVNSPSLEKFLESHPKLLIIINDAMRATPTERVLDAIYDFIKDRDFRLLVACGSHRVPTEDDLKYVLGKFYSELKDRLNWHDAKDDKNLEYIGTTSRGTAVHINKAVLEADGVIVINSVEPHYFAGHTGGRKAVLPGVSSFKTIETNHRNALQPEAQQLVLKGNPVHEDMEEAARLLLEKKDVFCINTVFDKDRHVCACAAGDMIDSFYEAVKFSEKVWSVKIKAKADIVVTVTRPPLDINLYQAQKALDNARYAVKTGGIIIWVAACREGIGPEEFYKLLSSVNSPQEVFDRIAKEFKLGWQKAAKMVEIFGFSDVWMVTRLSDGVVKGTFMKPCKTVQAAIDDALKLKGSRASVIFLMEGDKTVPFLQHLV